MGDHIKFTPPASAIEQSPHCKARTASCRATSDAAQAVSLTTLGPRKSRKWETRLAMMEKAKLLLLISALKMKKVLSAF